MLERFLQDIKKVYNNSKNTVVNYFNDLPSSYKIISIDIISDKNNYQSINNYSGKIKIINIKNQKTNKNISFLANDLKDYKITKDKIIIKLMNNQTLKLSY